MPDWENDFKVDPYSAWVHNILEATIQATNNYGAMSEDEIGIINKTTDLLFELDPFIGKDKKDAAR